MGDWGFFFGAVCLTALVAVVAWPRLRARRYHRAREAWLKKPKSLGEMQAKIEDAQKHLELAHQSRVIRIVHDMSTDQAPVRDKLHNYLFLEETFDVLEQIRSTPKDIKIDVILHTPGGDSLATEMIAAALKARTAETTAYVPYIAMSGGTIIGLACDKIVMGPHASLGPIDSQFAGFPARAYTKLLESKPAQEISDTYLMLSYVVESRLKTSEARARELLNSHHKESVIDYLLKKDLYHGERITAKAMEAEGAKISGGCPKEVFEIVDMRIKMLRRPELAKESGIAEGPPMPMRSATIFDPFT